MSGPESWDDGTMDLVAAVEACRAGDRRALSTLMPNGDRDRMLVSGIKLLAEVCEEQDVSDQHLRAWAVQAVSR